MQSPNDHTPGRPSIPAHARVLRLSEAVPAVAVVGELDRTTAADVSVALRSACEDIEPGDVLIVDLSDLRFIDVGGARALANTARQLKNRGAVMVVRNPGRLTRRVMQICDLDRVDVAVVDVPPTGWDPVAEAEAILRSTCSLPEEWVSDRGEGAR
jgi:anti-anti-sigma factor